MNRGLYVAASGMLAMQARQDQLSNDLANASTPGYKQDRTAQKAFGDLLSATWRAASRSGPWPPAFASRSRPPTSGRAPLRSTDEPLDLGVDGEGYFGVQTAQGVRYTRNGRFAGAADGTLVDQMGNQVLGRAASPSAQDRRHRRPRHGRRLRAHEPA